jgi:hypothetical protein
MRVYDIALMLVRALVAMDLVRAVLDIGLVAIRFAFLMPAAQGDAWLSKVEITGWLSPIYSLVAAGILYLLAKPIARFAARFAAPIDAASPF